jgi:MFS family permease
MFALLAFLPRAVYTLYLMYALVFVAGVLSGFSRPAFTALEAQVVPPEHAARSQSWLSGFSQVGMIAGPALAGVCVDRLGVATTFALLAALSVGVIVCLVVIAPKPIPPVEQHESLRESVSQGVRYVLGNQLLIASMALDLFAVLFGGAMALLPVFAKDVLNVGATELGMLRTAPSAGALLIMAVTSRYPITRNAGWWLLGNVAAFGVAFIVFGLSTNFWLSLAMLFLTGIFDGVSMVVRMLILRFESPEHLRGRVAAVQWIFIGASNEIGAFESGVAARLLGTVPSVVAGGAVTLLVVVAVAALAPKLRKLHFDADRLAAG